MYEDLTFTEEQLAEMEAQAPRLNAKQYLRDTDWYVVRHAETGEEVPAEVTKKRAEARATASS